jgi:hypothetical protein
MSRYWVPENYEDEVGEYHPPDYDYCNKYGHTLEYDYFSSTETSATLWLFCDYCGGRKAVKNFGRVIVVKNGGRVKRWMLE